MKIRFIISIVAGAIAYFILRRLMPGMNFLCLGAGVFVFYLTNRMIRAAVLRREDTGKILPVKEQTRIVIEDGMRKLSLMRQQTMLIKNNDAAKKIQDICRIGVEIFDDIKKNPDDLRRAKPFVNYYLDAAMNIIKQYAELSNRKQITPEADKSIKKVEDILDSMKATFEKQLANLFEDDLLDLNAEIKVLEQTMKLEQ